MIRPRSVVLFAVLSIFLWGSISVYAADNVEILGVTLPTEKVVAGKTLTLNGVAYRKAFGIVKVYVVGLYLEKQPTFRQSSKRLGARLIRSERKQG